MRTVLFLTLQLSGMPLTVSFYAKTGTFTVKGITQDDSRMPVEATVIVNGIDPSKATVTVEPNEFTADGAAKEPAVTVVLDGATLKEGADYTVAYTNNVEPGTATVTVTGAGRFWYCLVMFTIKAAEPGSTLDKSKLGALVDKVKGYNKADYQSGWGVRRRARRRAAGVVDPPPTSRKWTRRCLGSSPPPTSWSRSPATPARPTARTTVPKSPPPSRATRSVTPVPPSSAKPHRRGAACRRCRSLRPAQAPVLIGRRTRSPG